VKGLLQCNKLNPKFVKRFVHFLVSEPLPLPFHSEMKQAVMAYLKLMMMKMFRIVM
jgi:hypothetical protein